MEELCIMFDSQSNKLPVKFRRSQAVADEGQQRLLSSSPRRALDSYGSAFENNYNDSVIQTSDLQE